MRNRTRRGETHAIRLLSVVFLLSFCCGSAITAQTYSTYTIQTLAGGGPLANVEGASVSFPGGAYKVAVDAQGDVLIAFFDGNIILRLDAATGMLTRVAGDWSSGGYSGDNGAATSAQLHRPQDIAVDSRGNLYIVDSLNFRVRMVSNGVITTVAGNGTPGSDGDGGAATSAQLDLPIAVTVDATGNLYIAEQDGFSCAAGISRIRKVSNGTITTVAGGASGYGGDGGPAKDAKLCRPMGLAVDAAGNLYIADSDNHVIRKISDGVITTIAGAAHQGGYNGGDQPATSAWLYWPGGVAFDADGNLYIADNGNRRIRKVSNGMITTVAGNGTPGNTGDGGPATSAGLYCAPGIAIDAGDNLYIADSDRVRKISKGVISTVAGGGLDIGDNGPATNAQLNGPGGVAVDTAGNVYVADWQNYRVRMISGGIIKTVAGNGTAGSGGDGGPATAAQLYHPKAIAVDQTGGLYIADTYISTIRKVSNGVISTIAGNGTSGYGGDGGPATSAELNVPYGVAVDSAGAVYIADTWNNRIRKVSNGIITTVAGNGTAGYSGDNGSATAAQLDQPIGVAVDAAGDFYIAEYASNGVPGRIRKVSDGVITTVAGNGNTFFCSGGDNVRATSAYLDRPIALAVDSSGTLYVSDPGTARIRKISNGVITTIAGNGAYEYEECMGNGVQGFSGDNGPAISAQLNTPWGVAVDTAGNVYFADSANNRVRVLVPVTFSSAGRFLPASGGSDTVNVTLPPGYSWTASSAAGWISFNSGTSGTGNCRISFTVAPNTGGARSATITIGGQPFTVQQASASAASLPFAGSMPQIASAGGWDTSITLINTGRQVADATVSFFGNDGSPLLLPISSPQPLLGGTVLGALLGATVEQTISTYALLTLESSGAATEAGAVGSAQLLTSGSVGGFAIFRYNPSGQEAVVPLETRNAGAYVLSFDNTGGVSTGVAVANVSSTPANIPVLIRDDTGASLGSVMINLPPEGHTSFMLSDNYGVTTAKRGTVEFRTPVGGRISVLGLRAAPIGESGNFAVTTIPVLADSVGGSGSMPQVASGQGWQTTFTLVNTGVTSAQAELKFLDNNGSPLSPPLTFPQSGTTTTSSSLNRTLAAGASLVITAEDAGTSFVGSAQLTTNGSISGFAIFRYNPSGQEAAVPLETRDNSAYVLPFDDTGGVSTGVAVANVSSTPADITVVILDETGPWIGSGMISLPPQGHTSFMLTDSYPQTAFRRGTVEFDTPPGGQISVLGLRAAPTGTGSDFAVTTIPVLVRPWGDRLP